MLNKIKNYYQSIKWHSQWNLRTLGQLFFLVIVLLISWSGVKAIQSNYELQKQVTTLQQQNQVQQLENSNLQLQNNYYNTNQYLELSARQELGLGSPGETELIVPQNIALATLANLASSQNSSNKNTTQLPWYERNVKSWFDFFLHRNTTANDLL
jgi:cell division protein FtsL